MFSRKIRLIILVIAVTPLPTLALIGVELWLQHLGPRENSSSESTYHNTPEQPDSVIFQHSQQDKKNPNKDIKTDLCAKQHLDNLPTAGALVFIREPNCLNQSTTQYDHDKGRAFTVGYVYWG